jgi:peptidoglycan/LPS O-acetylase OafA/YrhL
MRRLYGLDALRGIAALIVLLLHVRLNYHLPAGPFSRGYLAVDFFFMLSGYIMARTYETEGGFKLSGRQFLVKRFWRLWRPMAMGAALASAWLVMTGVGVPNLPLIVLPMFLLLPNPLTWLARNNYYPGNDPEWSITAELVANALHAPVFSRLGVRGLLLVVIGALLALRLMEPGLGGLGSSILQGAPLRAVAGYCLGIVVWRARGESSFLSPWFGVLALPGIILLLSLSDTPDLDLVFFAVCPFILIAGVGGDVTGIGGLLGALSFPLYAVHTPIILIVEHFGGSPWLALASALAGGIVAMAIVDHGRAIRALKGLPARRLA